ncbi:MAG TPA: hypothetical protein VLE73_04750 [Candidatus Saccharimonadales bacterium]|nr:hypothetical protein [Candidatus Saccharimonadales bacterium]
MRDLHIIMPMAGAGSRFAKAGFTTPKPLIQVDGKPMFMKALSALEPIKANKHYTYHHPQRARRTVRPSQTA